MIPSSKPLFFCIAFVLFFFCSPVSAENVTLTFTDMGIGLSQKVLIYAPNAPLGESFVGEFNASDTVSLFPETSYVIAFKPGVQSWLDNPLEALEIFKASIPPIMIAALFLGTIFCVVFLFWRLFSK